MRCVLMTAWDPISIGDAPQVWDEYENYAPGVANRLREEAEPTKAAEQVSTYLDHIEAHWIGTAIRTATGHLAHRLVAWHHWSYTCSRRPPRECAYPR